MTEYRTGNHWGVTIVREYDHLDVPGLPGGLPRSELVAVVVNGDRELAERICALLNATSGNPRGDHPTCIEVTTLPELTAGKRSFLCGADCPRPQPGGGSPAAGLSATESAPEPSVGGAGGPGSPEADLSRFEVYAASDLTIGIMHSGCPGRWCVEAQDFTGLAELNQRAGEHAEVCR